MLLVSLVSTKVEIEALELELERREKQKEEMLAKLKVCISSHFVPQENVMLSLFSFAIKFQALIGNLRFSSSMDTIDS